MAEGDFSWLWRNEELSDFLLIIREVSLRQPDVPEPAAAATDGQETEPVRTRAGKRRYAAATTEEVRRTSRVRTLTTTGRNQPEQEGPAAPAAQQEQQTQHVAHQQSHAPALNTTRVTRSKQTHELRQLRDGSGQQVRPNGDVAQRQQQGPRGTVANVRRPRRQMTAHSTAIPIDDDDTIATALAAAAAAAGGAIAGPERVTRSRSKQRQAPPESLDSTTAAAAFEQAAATAAGSSRAAGRKLHHQQQAVFSSAAAAATAAAFPQLGAGASAAAAGASQPQIWQQQQQSAVEIRVPVHAVVLAGFSEYFKALICSWSGNLNRTLTLDVGPGDATAAEHMVEFMYTGKLPAAAPPEELLKMIRLADQYQVTRFLAAASSSFESLPLSDVNLSVVLEVFSLPQLMLDAPEMARVITKAKAKLLDLYGDLEKVWGSEVLRDEFYNLPFAAVQCLLASDQTAVAAENTALVALAGWIEEGAVGHTITPTQRKQLLSLIRLPYFTSSFIGDILQSVSWIRDSLDTRQLLNAFQFAVASESTRQRLATYDTGPSSSTPHYRCPRPLSSVTRASFEWSIELSTIKRMVEDAQLWGRVVELSSPLHYFAGFWWQLSFNVEKSPAAPDPTKQQQQEGAAPAAAAGAVVEFVGVRCHVNCGSNDYWPHVVRFKASIAALQTGFWEMDYAYMKAIEGPIVDGVGLGYPGFFALPGQALESEAAWSRFVRGGRVHLKAEILDCE